tara:strand:+ start:6628 stop:7458 length:831 start_codon:yes stop_codon:yes gene_type:complete
MIQQDEKQSIRAFCNLHRQIDQATKPLSEKKSELNRQKKVLKEELYKTLKDNNWNAVKISDQGTDMYARIQLYKSQKPLSIDIVRGAMDELDNSKALVEAIFDSIQDSRTTSREFVQVTKSKPRDVVVEQSSVVTQMGQKWKSYDEHVKSVNQELKQVTKELKDELSSHQNIVQNYMNRAALTSQRININERNGTVQSYFIRKKTSQRKAKLNNGLIQSLIRQVLEEGQYTSFADVEEAKDDVAARIVEKIEGLPKEKTERVTLDKGALKRPPDEE